MPIGHAANKDRCGRPDLRDCPAERSDLGPIEVEGEGKIRSRDVSTSHDVVPLVVTALCAGLDLECGTGTVLDGEHQVSRQTTQDEVRVRRVGGRRKVNRIRNGAVGQPPGFVTGVALVPREACGQLGALRRRLRGEVKDVLFGARLTAVAVVRVGVIALLAGIERAVSADRAATCAGTCHRAGAAPTVPTRGRRASRPRVPAGRWACAPCATAAGRLAADAVAEPGFILLANLASDARARANTNSSVTGRAHFLFLSVGATRVDRGEQCADNDQRYDSSVHLASIVACSFVETQQRTSILTRGNLDGTRFLFKLT